MLGKYPFYRIYKERRSPVFSYFHVIGKRVEFNEQFHRIEMSFGTRPMQRGHALYNNTQHV